MNRRVARCGSQGQASKMQSRSHWTTNRKISAASLRHTNRLRRLHWHHLCESLHPITSCVTVSRCVNTLFTQITKTPVAGLAISKTCSASALSEQFADMFSRCIPAPRCTTTVSVPSGQSHLAFAMDDGIS